MIKIYNTKELIKNADSIDFSKKIGYKSNIESLDNIARICKQQLTIITARANNGKSTFIDYYCYMLAKHSNVKTLFISFETDATFHTALLMKYCNTDILQEMMLFADTTELNTIEDIIKLIEFAKNNFNIDNVVIDPFNFISTDQTNDTNAICKVLKELKNTAVKNDISVILVAHPKKLQADEQINGESINGSIHFRNVADLILVLTTNFDTRETTIKVDKLRYNKIQGQMQKSITLRYSLDGTYKETDEIDVLDFLFDDSVEKKDVTRETNERISHNIMDAKVSYLNSVYDKQTTEITLKEALTTKAEEVISKQEQLRQLQTKEDIQAYKRDNLPLFSPSVIFDSNGTTANNIKQTNNIICIDIDGQDNNYISAEEMKEIVKNINYVFYAQESASGKGIFCLIQIKDKNKFKEHFNAIEELFKQHNLNIDKQCNDINRKRFISYDKQPYFNCDAIVFKDIKEHTNNIFIPNTEVKTNNTKQFPSNWINLNDKQKAEYIADYCINNNIVLNKNHNDTLKLCSIYSSIFKNDNVGLDIVTKLRKQRKGIDENKLTSTYYNCTKLDYAINALVIMFKAA